MPKVRVQNQTFILIIHANILFDTVNGKVPEMLVNVLLDQREGSHSAAVVGLLGFHRPLHRLVLSDALVTGAGGEEFSVALNLLL